MTPGSYPLSLYHGDSAAFDFVLWADSQKTVHADLTGVSAAAQIRDKRGGQIVMSFECDVDEITSTIHVRLNPDDWIDGLKRGVWDLQLTYPSGDVTTVITGDVTITQDVTVVP